MHCTSKALLKQHARIPISHSSSEILSMSYINPKVQTEHFQVEIKNLPLQLYLPRGYPRRETGSGDLPFHSNPRWFPSRLSSFQSYDGTTISWAEDKRWQQMTVKVQQQLGI